MGITPRDIKHSQHRRAEWLDYSGVSLYMITLCVEGRHPVFGYLTGKMRASRGSDDFPHLVPSNLGKLIINEELPKLRSYYPQIEIWQVALMPDHLHLLLYIREPLPPGKHLGHLIAGFKGGCSRAWWRITEPAANTTGTTAASVASTPGVPVASASNAVVPVASASGKPISNYARFHHLNDLAAEICATTDATLLGISELCNGK